MSTLLSTNQSKPLNASESNDVLERALAQRVPIQLSALGAPNAAVWRGAFDGTTDDDLVLLSVDRWVEIPCDWHDTLLGATFCSANRAYSFKTRLTDPVLRGPSHSLGVVRPHTIELIERRRAVRRRFRETTGVRLYVGSVGSRPLECILLNLSAHGLACRAGSDVGTIVTTGSMVRVQFALDRDGRPFELDGRVVTATPADEGNFVLGIEFIEDHKSDVQRSRLARLLAGAEPNAACRTSFA